MSREYTFGKGSIYKETPGKGVNPGGSDLSRIIPRQISTGFMRGTQGVGSGGAKIDASNNRIVLSASDGSSVGIGTIPDDTSGAVGFFSTDTNGKLIMKIVNGTMYVYDPDTGLNTLQVGLLPDGVGGIAGANEGYEVADGFS